MFKAFWKSEGVRCLKIASPVGRCRYLRNTLASRPPRSPQANAFCECYIGTYKHQCLTGCALLRSSVPSGLAIRLAYRLLAQAVVLCLSLDQFDYINRKWVTYYNNERPHQGKDIGNKILRPDFTPSIEGEIVRHEALGGVLAWYERNAA